MTCTSFLLWPTHTLEKNGLMLIVESCFLCCLVIKGKHMYCACAFKQSQLSYFCCFNVLHGLYWNESITVASLLGSILCLFVQAGCKNLTLGGSPSSSFSSHKRLPCWFFFCIEGDYMLFVYSILSYLYVGLVTLKYQYSLRTFMSIKELRDTHIMIPNICVEF